MNNNKFLNEKLIDGCYVDGKNIVVENLAEFNTKDILTCGQTFRFKEFKNSYEVFSKNLKCVLINEKNRVIIESDNVNYFLHYFDLFRSYSVIKECLLKMPKMQKPIDFGSGIRILNQDPAEMIISFIISANNNIPRIKGIIEKMCIELGEKHDGYYSFPNITALANADLEFYRSVGTGYRASYIKETAQSLISQPNLLNLYNIETESARKLLLQLKGVGRKVADCILLFGFHKEFVFPVDTWIKRVYNDYGSKGSNNPTEMSKELVDIFESLSGYAQQYLFYYYRETNTLLEGLK